MRSDEFICKSNIYIFHILLNLIEIVQLELYVGSFKYPAYIYLLKRNNKHTRTRCDIYSALIIKTQVSNFMILGFKLPFSVLSFIEQIVGKVLF